MDSASATLGKRLADNEGESTPKSKRTTTSSEASCNELDIVPDADVESADKLEKIAGAMKTIIEVTLFKKDVVDFLYISAIFSAVFRGRPQP